MVKRASQVALVVKNQPANAGDAGGVNSVAESGRSTGVRNGDPLESSCLEKPTDRGAWQTTVESDTTEYTCTEA